MNETLKPKMTPAMVDMHQLEGALSGSGGARVVDPEVEKYAPPKVRNAAAQPFTSTMGQTPLQKIAADIKRLVYDDTIEIGNGLAIEWEKVKDANHLEQSFASVIQHWASGVLDKMDQG